MWSESIEFMEECIAYHSNKNESINPNVIIYKDGNILVI